MNIKKWVSEVIGSVYRKAIPLMTIPGIELLNYCVEDAVKNGQIHFEAIQKLNNTYPSAACTVIMDLTVEAEAFGAKIQFSKNDVPNVVGRLVSDYKSVETLKVPDINNGRIYEYLKANYLAATNIKNKPVLSGCIGVFTLAGRLFDLSEMMIALYTEPQTITLLLDKCTQFITEYIRAIKSTGVNGVIIAEPSAGLVSNQDCSVYSSFYIGKIIEELQDDNFMIVLHNCGNTGHCTDAMIETKAAGLHFGNKIDMTEVLKKCPSDTLVMGNIDPVGVLKQGTPKYVQEETFKLLKQTSEWKNFILSTGCDVPPNVTSTNIEAFYSVLNKFNES